MRIEPFMGASMRLLILKLIVNDEVFTITGGYVPWCKKKLIILFTYKEV